MALALLLAFAVPARAQISYCSPTFANGCWSWNNQSVTLNTLSWSLGATSCTLSDYTNLSTTLVAGQSYPMSVSNGNWCGCAVWIDFDYSGTFDPSENLYHLYNAQAIQTYNFNITIPALTPNGTYRMRVIAPWGSDGFNVGANGYGGCGAYQYGNFDDFSILIQNSSCAPTYDTLQAQACDSYTSPSGNQWNLPGVYSDTIPNQAGCDSILNIDLSLGFTTTNSLFESACGSYTAPSGAVYNTDGMYLDTIPNQSGCDSVMRITLTMLRPSFDTLHPVACDQYLSPAGNIYFVSATFEDTLSNAAGCDSLVYVDLILNHSSADSIFPNACGVWTSPLGNTYDSTGVYTEMYTNSGGCDSIVTISLTIQSVDTSVSRSGNTLTAVQTGASYQWLNCESNYLPVNGATAQSFNPANSGSYAVAVSLGPGCSDTSACRTVTVVGNAAEYDPALFSVSPNPSSGIFRIDVANSFTGGMEVYDLNGRLLLHYAEIPSTMDLSRFGKGLYILRLLNTPVSKTWRLIVD